VLKWGKDRRRQEGEKIDGRGRVAVRRREEDVVGAEQRRREDRERAERDEGMIRGMVWALGCYELMRDERRG
jgi:hypothetical protein